MSTPLQTANQEFPTRREKALAMVEEAREKGYMILHAEKPPIRCLEFHSPESESGLECSYTMGWSGDPIALPGDPY